MNGAPPLASGAALTRLGGGATWSEGPLWMPASGRVRWSDIPGNRILELDPETLEVTVYRDDVEFTNGRTLDHDGAVIQCSHGRRALEIDRDGVVSTLVDGFDGRRLNSPNDVVVARDGSVWFTDPPYGIVQEHEGHLGEPEYGGCYVFRWQRNGSLDAVIHDLEEPNGLAFSPDESRLYVSDTSAALRPDSGNHHIVEYRVHLDGGCERVGVLFEVPWGIPDGMRVDVEGRIWTSGGAAVWVLSPLGEVLERIDVPERVGNLCFGGPDGHTLFVAATTSIYAIDTTTTDATFVVRGGRS